MRFSDLSWPDRLAVMRTVEDAGSMFEGRYGNGFRVAVGVGAFTRLIAALPAWECTDLVKFPLGTDTPPEYLQHRGDWLFATFMPRGE